MCVCVHALAGVCSVCVRVSNLIQSSVAWQVLFSPLLSNVLEGQCDAPANIRGDVVVTVTVAATEVVVEVTDPPMAPLLVSSCNTQWVMVVRGVLVHMVVTEAVAVKETMNEAQTQQHI